ncbi:hypothetical protein [Streptomyces sp. NPDC051636]|uniref:hypothetical protein n=1 Tax=Streptomyces sp. NPDC051636 TaxID=3365663 RepID=UPI0037BA60D7
MNRRTKLWSAVGGVAGLCSAVLGVVLVAGGEDQGYAAPASPGNSASATPDLVPGPSAELLAYGACLRKSGLHLEHTSGLIIVKAGTSATELKAAKHDCTQKQQDFAATIEAEGEGSKPEQPEQADFQGRMGGCVAAQGVAWPIKQRVADRSDPVYLASDPRVPAMRNCIAHNMVLPGEGKPSPT